MSSREGEHEQQRVEYARTSATSACSDIGTSASPLLFRRKDRSESAFLSLLAKRVLDAENICVSEGHSFLIDLLVRDRDDRDQ